VVSHLGSGRLRRSGGQEGQRYKGNIFAEVGLRGGGVGGKGMSV